jgi:hypothetical protein
MVKRKQVFEFRFAFYSNEGFERVYRVELVPPIGFQVSQWLPPASGT